MKCNSRRCRADNPADAFTKPLDQRLIDKHMGNMGFQWSSGRTESAVQLNSLSEMLSMCDERDTESDGEGSTDAEVVPRMLADYGKLILHNQHRSLTQFTPQRIGQ